MRGLKRDRTARVIVAAHAFVKNLRRASTIWAATYRPSAGSPTHSLNWPSLSDPVEGLDGPNHGRTSANATAPPGITSPLTVEIFGSGDVLLAKGKGGGKFHLELLFLS
jgi:hypothetical protein